MTVEPPTFDSDEIRKLCEELANEGNPVPKPDRVEIVPAEDFDGDPVFWLKVTFPKDMPVETTQWKQISPLIQRLRKRALEETGYERSVLSVIVRLAEPS